MFVGYSMAEARLPKPVPRMMPACGVVRPTLLNEGGGFGDFLDLMKHKEANEKVKVQNAEFCTLHFAL